MYEVAIIKKTNLLLEQIICVLEEELPIRKVTCYHPDQHHMFYNQTELPDMIIIDMDTHTKEELFQFAKFCSEQPIKTIVWTSHNIGHHFLTRLFKLSLDGYFYNEMETSDLIFAINGTFYGKQYIHPYLSSILLNDYLRLTNVEEHRPSGLLTKREWEVLELIVKGKKTCSIGEKLYISSKTVTNHVASILRKLHVEDRTNAALLAVRERWIIL